MPLIIGVVLALAVGALGTSTGMDRDRAFYPVIMLVIAVLYLLFACIGNSTRALGLEAPGSAVFVIAAVAGFKRSLWIVVAALAGHGGFDVVHAKLIANPGVPLWWPAFCGAYDVTAAAYLAWLLKSDRVRARA